jgi:hypothetical protein
MSFRTARARLCLVSLGYFFSEEIALDTVERWFFLGWLKLFFTCNIYSYFCSYTTFFVYLSSSFSRTRMLRGRGLTSHTRRRKNFGE